MNKCFLLGYLINDVEFSFTLKKNPISVAKFDLKLSNNSTVKVYSFDANADFCYSRLKKGNSVIIEGKINTKHNIIAENIYKT